MDIEQIVKEVSSEMSKEAKAMEMQTMLAEFLRRCLSKLAEREVDAPVATVVISTTGMFAGIKRNLVLHQDAPLLFDGDKLYTEAQYIAAQQKAAEACAKVCENHNGAWIADVMRSIHAGDWREYL